MDSGAPTPAVAASAEKMTSPEGGSRGAGGADDGAAGSDGRARPAVQVIDFDGNFSPELKPFLERSSLIRAGSDYAIVGVIGAQSSGKSTLLNLLFKTPFAVMDASHGRTQTTQGIWASVADSPLLVLDVEGTDSSTRGEDHMTFERKSALLAMALCDVVIVNMWEHDVGRQEASNYTLLRTVFEVNLQLRRSVSKTLLLFTLRDRVSTPLEMLSRRLRDDVQAIWAAAAKPDRWRDAAFADFFDLDFVALPHKVLQPVEFARSVDELRTRFMPVAEGAAADAGLLRPEYRKTVPADGLATYMQQLWEEIIACRDVDIPASRTLLAAFRCDELAAAAQRQMDEAMQSLAEQATRGPVKEFRRRVEEAHAAALASYDALGSRYDHTVYSEKRAALETALWSRAQRVFAEHVRRLAAHATVSVQRELRGVRSLPAERATELVRSQLTAFCQRVQEDRPAAAQWAITPLLLAFAQDLLPVHLAP